MHKTAKETEVFFRELEPLLPEFSGEVWIFPSFLSLGTALKNRRRIRIGSQNMHEKNSGAYTGEISAPMLKEVGVEGVLLGHSERREYYGETDEKVGEKCKKAWEYGFFPVLCVGEKEEVRKKNQEKEWVRKQLDGIFQGISSEVASSFAIAYEPVWAIGTGRNATKEDAEEMHTWIREILKEKGFSPEIPILYGGSVTPENAYDLLSCPNVDGVLVGGASLDPHRFLSIVRSGIEAKFRKEVL
jgi:triosephosphate isomerase